MCHEKYLVNPLHDLNPHAFAQLGVHLVSFVLQDFPRRRQVGRVRYWQLGGLLRFVSGCRRHRNGMISAPSMVTEFNTSSGRAFLAIDCFGRSLIPCIELTNVTPATLAMSRG